VKQTDLIDVSVRVLETDRKRIRAAFDLRCGRYPDPVATAEQLLLHVHQGEQPKAQTFPPEVVEALARFAAESESAATGSGGPPTRTSGGGPARGTPA